MRLGEEQILIRVVVRGPKAGKGDSASQRILLIVKQVTRRELIVLADLVIDAQLRLTLAIRLGNEERTRSKLNRARSGTTRTSADVDVLEIRLTNNLLRHVHEQIDAGIRTNRKQASQLAASGLR